MKDTYYYNLIHKKNRWQEGDLKAAVEFMATRHNAGELSRLLEIGCGRAEILGHIPSDISYTGLDLTESCIQDCQFRHPDKKFLVADAEQLPFPDDSFDAVFSHQVLEMLHDPRRGLKEMMRVVRSRGYVIIIAPNLEAPWSEVHAVRHYTKLQHAVLFFQRVADLFLRMFGKLRFRVLPHSYTEVTGTFEKSDDDLKYVTSAYEVSKFFKNHGFKKIHAKRYPGTSWRVRLMAKLAVFRYYGSGIYFIFQKA